MRSRWLNGPWGRRAKWRLYAGAAAGLTALATTLVLVMTGGDSPHHELVAEEPTPTATTDITQTSEATPTPTPDASAEASAAPAAAASASVSRADRTPALGPSDLLSDGYAAAAFGAGVEGASGTLAGGTGAHEACWEISGPGWDDQLTRTWTWPGETVVAETVTVNEAAGAASAVLGACRIPGPGWREAHVPTSTDLDLGDEGFLSIGRAELYTQISGGARVGRALVLLTWRRSGPVPSTDAFEQALRDAVGKVLLGSEGTARPVPPQSSKPELRRYLNSDELPPRLDSGSPRARGLYWNGDSREPALGPQAGISCGSPDSHLQTVDVPVHRHWNGGSMNGDDGQSLEEVTGDSGTEADAMRAFDAGRTAVQADAPSTFFESVGDLGDGAFVADWSADWGSPSVYVRFGSRFLVIRSHWEGDAVPIARSALAKLQTSAGT
ncbi:MAG: hypothetical protein M3P04_07720 [Actinomycetota bacterium]|nr:hypothetical protein [Actinomycetota bacterium]